MQHGQVFAKGPSNWAYRYRLGGRDSKRVQRSGFPTETGGRSRHSTARSSEPARSRASPRRRRSASSSRSISLSTTPSPETIEKLRWLLSKATARFGDLPISELQPAEIAAWRMTIPSGHRFEATQALRQVLGRAVSWGMININPAKQGVENPQRRASSSGRSRSWDELNGSPTGSDRGSGRWSCSPPRPGCVQASGSRSSSATSTEAARVVYVRRAYRNGRIKRPKTARQPPRRPAPTGRARRARRAARDATGSALVFPRRRGGYLDLHNFRYRHWKPAQRDARDRPDPADLRSPPHLRHLRAARRHLDLRPLPLHGRQPDDDRPPLRPPRQRRPPARDRLLDTLAGNAQPPDVHTVDAKWTPRRGHAATRARKTASKQDIHQSPLTDSNRRPLPYHGSALPAELRGRWQERSACGSAPRDQ